MSSAAAVLKRILVRCDASLLIGSGHVIRCRTLAREFCRYGAEVTFVCRRQPGDLISMLEDEFTVLVLPEHRLAVVDVAEFQSLEGRDLYAMWLGCSQEQDAADFMYAVRKASLIDADCLIVDHYGLDINWERQIISSITSNDKPKLLVIDDLADRSHQTDFLLDQNYFGEITQKRYQNLIPSECQVMLGPKFSLLGPEYSIFHELIPPRNELNRILIYFGGVDNCNLTGQALDYLCHDDFSHLSIDVVIGSQSTHSLKVARTVSNRPKTSLHRSLPSLAGLIARSDFSLGAGGATTWERACMGLPSLVIPVSDNQVQGSMYLHSEEYIVMSKTLSPTIITEAFARLKELSQKSVQLTDGGGCSLVTQHLLTNFSN